MLGADVQVLKVREAIRAVLARYSRGIDRLDRDSLLSAYHPDAIDDHNVYTGSPAGFADFAFSGLEAYFDSSFYHYGTTAIEVDGDDARCESYIFSPKVLKERTGDGAKQLWIGGGRFLDRFERRDGEWRIIDRKLVSEWGFIATGQTKSVGPYPHPPADSNVYGRRDRSDPSYAFWAGEKV
jgi:hypothetical protein